MRKSSTQVKQNMQIHYLSIYHATTLTHRKTPDTHTHIYTYVRTRTSMQES